MTARKSTTDTPATSPADEPVEQVEPEQAEPVDEQDDGAALVRLDDPDDDTTPAVYALHVGEGQIVRLGEAQAYELPIHRV